MNAYLCVSVDCECDKGPEWRTQRPLAFRAVLEGIGERLHPLFLRHRMKPTYLLSPELMRDDASLELLAARDGEAELGTHLHGEFAEPEAQAPEVTDAFQCHYDRETERRKLAYLTDLFRASFGHPPRSFRAGRFGIGVNSLSLLEELGYAVDSSVTPFKDWRKAGATLSFRNAPTQPYWPAADDPARAAPAPGRLLEVPVTIRPSRLPLFGRWTEQRWLRPTHASAERLIAVARDEITSAMAARPGRPVVLTCMFHNVEVVAGASPYAASEAQAGAILSRLESLLAFAEREAIGGIGLGDVPALFEA